MIHGNLRVSFILLFLVLGLGACEQRSSHTTTADTCSVTIVWRPDVLPGRLQEVDPERYRDDAINRIREILERDGDEMSVEAQSGFVVRFSHIQCDPDSVETVLLPHGLPGADPSGGNEPFSYLKVPPAELSERTLAEFSDDFIAWDAKMLGMPPIGSGESPVAGPNGYGRCNVFGTWEASSDVAAQTPPPDMNQLFDDFFGASLSESNDGDYDYVPWVSAMGDVVGVSAFGECDEASRRTVEYLDHIIARMDGWGTDRPVTYQLFLPEQVEGLSQTEINYQWRVEGLQPEGHTNAE